MTPPAFFHAFGLLDGIPIAIVYARDIGLPGVRRTVAALFCKRCGCVYFWRDEHRCAPPTFGGLVPVLESATIEA